MAKKKNIIHHHHIIYEGNSNKEVIRCIRPGVHQALTILRRFNHLTLEEINTIEIEINLKRKFDGE